jgi:hypothetical protein
MVAGRALLVVVGTPDSENELLDSETKPRGGVEGLVRPTTHSPCTGCPQPLGNLMLHCVTDR